MHVYVRARIIRKLFIRHKRKQKKRLQSIREILKFQIFLSNTTYAWMWIGQGVR